MEFKILEIVVNKDDIRANKIAVLNLAGKPINPFVTPLWQLTNDGKEKKNPTAFLMKGNETAGLKVKINIKDTSPGEEYTLNLYCKDELNLINFDQPMFSGDFEIKNSGEEYQTIFISVQNLFNPFNITVVKNFAWEIIPKDQKGNNEKKDNQEEHEIELYWFNDAMDYFLFRKGVPVEILRYFAEVCIVLAWGSIQDLSGWGGMQTVKELGKIAKNIGEIQIEKELVKIAKKIEDIIVVNRDTVLIQKFLEKKIIEYQVVTSFFRNPPRYDIYYGDNHFADVTFQPNYTVRGTIFLDEYWNSIYDDDALCNCKDQAALLYVFLEAVGIDKINICSMNPFGFLRLTNLVGRGICNNPTYKEKRLQKIIDQESDQRTQFGYHSFCSLDGQWILDSCAGPHTGTENREQYAKYAVDFKYPPNRGPHGNKDNIKDFKVAASLDYITSGDENPDNHLLLIHRDEFQKELNIAEKSRWPKKIEYFIVCPWPDPRSCPVLGTGWEIFYENISAGDKETRKVWKLRKQGERVDIKLYMSNSMDVKPLINRLIYFGSTSSQEKLPYTKGPSYLGKFSARSHLDNPVRHFWIPGKGKDRISNVLFDVTCTNVTFNVQALLVWLNLLAFANRESSPDNPDKYLPSIEGFGYSPEQPKIGDLVKMKFRVDNPDEPNDLLIDFWIAKRSGLCCIHESNDKNEYSLEFIVDKESENQLYITAVNRKTLLSKTIKEIKIHIKSG